MGARHAVAFLLALGAGLALPVSAPAERLRVATWNVETLGDPDAAVGTPARDSWDAMVRVLRRLDADVVLVQEVAGSSEEALVPRLALEAGFSEHAVSTVSGTLSGGLRTACLSRLPLVPGRARSWSSAQLSTTFGGTASPAANDLARDVLAVALDAGGPSPWTLLTVHLKSGGTNADRFRRQVEILRLLQAVQLERIDAGAGPLLVAGDFNEDPRDAPFTDSWSALPPGLPASYQLGSDVTLPIAYDPFGALAAEGLSLLPAGHEDAPAIVLTRPASGRRIDLAFLGAAAGACQTLVYESCRDDGVDASPWGDWLPLTAAPLACGTTLAAADHLPVVLDLRRLAGDVGPAALGAALRVGNAGDPAAAFVTAELDWSLDAGAPRLARDHYHVLAGASPLALALVNAEGWQAPAYADSAPRAATAPSTRFLLVRAADHCEAESR